eukprot:3888249-Prymnesium_polylepis.1
MAASPPTSTRRWCTDRHPSLHRCHCAPPIIYRQLLPLARPDVARGGGGGAAARRRRWPQEYDVRNDGGHTDARWVDGGGGGSDERHVPREPCAADG